MNELIKELAEQATAFVDEFGVDSTTYNDERDAKFAELIVRECIEQYWEAEENGERVPDRLLTHFGVE